MYEEDRQNNTMPVDQDERHMIHVHTMMAETEVSDDHQHVLMTVSTPARVAGGSHVHRVRGRTSFFSGDDTDGHWHWFDTVSGPAIAMPNDMHTHYIEGDTSYDDGHCHAFDAVLGLAADMDDSDDDADDCMHHNHKYKHKKYRDELNG